MKPGSADTASAERIVRRLLSLRGILDDRDVAEYLNPSISFLAHPSDLPGITEAAAAILDCRSKIVVFGDYDCDGICASAILVKCLTLLGRTAMAFMPERLSEGYGMSDTAVERMLRTHPDAELVVTVDNGVNSVRQIRELKARGIKVVVTDHHLPGDELPDADVLVNPCVRPGKKLSAVCGAAVAFMLAGRLVEEAKARSEYSGGGMAGPMLVLAGLATVTDAMPLVGQNRILVSQALRLFRAHAPLGLRKLHERAAKTAAPVTSRDFGFAIGPRINASGRLASGMDSLELLLCEDEDIAGEYARIIDRRNDERKALEQKMVDEAMSMVVPGASAQVIALGTDHPGAVGVVGIVASRVMERIAADPVLSGSRGAVPVCVIAAGRGSARSPGHLNIRDALEHCSDMLEHFGGHAAAAGFSVKEGRTGDFRGALADYCRLHRAAGPRKAAVTAADRVEIWLDGSEATLELARAVAGMEPFGEGNEEPVFGIRGVRISQARAIGQDSRHLQFSLVADTPLKSVWWNHGDREEELRLAGMKKHDVVFNLTVSRYAAEHVQLRIIDVTPAAADDR